MKFNIVCAIPALKPGKHGTPPVLVAENALCEDCGKYHEIEKCPKCSSWITPSVGGDRVTKYCNNDDCDWTFIEVWED